MFTVETRYGPNLPNGWKSGGRDLPTFKIPEWVTSADLALQDAVDIVGASARDWEWYIIRVIDSQGYIAAIKKSANAPLG